MGLSPETFFQLTLFATRRSARADTQAAGGVDAMAGAQRCRWTSTRRARPCRGKTRPRRARGTPRPGAIPAPLTSHALRSSPRDVNGNVTSKAGRGGSASGQQGATEPGGWCRPPPPPPGALPPAGALVVRRGGVPRCWGPPACTTAAPGSRRGHPPAAPGLTGSVGGCCKKKKKKQQKPKIFFLQ